MSSIPLRSKRTYLLSCLLCLCCPLLLLLLLLPVEQASAVVPWPAALPVLMERTDAVVVAEVLGSHSHWDASHTTIVTEHSLLARNLLFVGADASLTQGGAFTLTTTGGYLPAEQLGLWVSHEAVFAPGETALLLLTSGGGATGQALTLVREELGKYSVQGGMVRNAAAGVETPLALFLQTLDRELATRGLQLSPGEVLTDTVAVQGVTPTPALLGPAAAHDEPPRWLTAGLELSVLVNLNSDQIDEVTKHSADFYLAIRRAMRTWSVVENADFTLLYSGETTQTAVGYNGENEIVFMHKGANKPIGQAQIWYTAENVILEVDMWLNDDYPFSVADEPGSNEIDLESLVLHELGHWAPLEHSANPDAVMYSVLGVMEQKRALHADDVAALTQLHPCDLAPCLNEVYLTAVPTATPQPPGVATPTPTLVPTSATPTLIPTQLPTGIKFIYLPMIAR
jgi:hypothetical protein